MKRSYRLFAAVLVIAILITAGLHMIKAGATGLSGVQWTQVGPAPLQINAEQNYQGAGPDSGQVVDIAVDPRTSDKTIYIATGSGGVWKSDDSGTTWAPKTDKLLTLSTGAVALDPGNPSIVYVGTNNPAFGGDCPGCTFNAVGIYKSIDGGNTWTLLANSPKNTSIRRIVFPVPGTLLVAATNGLWRSTDAGGTFTKLSGSVLPAGDANDIQLDTQHPDTTVRVAVQGLGIFVSANITAATPTFTNMWTNSNGSPIQTLHRPGGIGFIAFRQSVTNTGKTIYTTVGNSNPGSGNSRFEGMWVTTDADMGASSTWANLPGADSAGDADGNNGGGCQCGYDQTIGVDPSNDQTVYIGFQQLWKSTNGGGGFGNISANKIHWDHHAFTFSPHDTSGQTFYVGEDGGVATSSDGGNNFTNINGSTSFANGAIASNLLRQIDIGRNSDANRKWTYGGFQDTGNAQLGDAGSGYVGNTWQLGQDGDGGPMTVDPCNNQHAITTDDGGYSQTTNGGGGWGGGVTLSPAPAHTPTGDSFGFDQTCDNTVYGGFTISDPNGVDPTTFGLYQSTDNGGTYTRINPFTTSVRAIATAKIDPNVVWVGLNNGQLAYSTNALLGATSTWTPVTIPGAPGQAVLGVAIDPLNTDIVFVVYPGIAGASPSKHVFMTSDRGAHWSDISGTGANGLPDLPLHSVAVDPSTASSPRTVIVGGDGGVFQTTDDGANWQVLGLGLPTVGVTTVALDSSTSPSLLRIGTYGRSSFELGAATGPLLSINTTLNFGILCSGQSPTTLLQLFNVGATDLTITNIKRVSGSGDFVVSGPTFPQTIKPGEEIDWTVQLTTTASSANPETAVFEIDSNDSFNPAQQVTYVATIGAPNGSTSIANGGDFGNVCVGSFADLALTVNNKGSCNLLVSGIGSNDADFLPPSILSYPLSVQAGTSISPSVRFEPLSFGTKNGVITVQSNNPGGNMSVNVTGNAPPGKIAVSGNGGFGNVCAGGANGQQTFTIGNTGPCNLSVVSVTLDNGSDGMACDDFKITNNPFPAILSHDSSLPVTVTFTPTKVGDRSCRLVITSDDPSTPVDYVALTATTPPVSMDVPPDNGSGYNFPATVIQSVGACSSKNAFPVSNNGLCPVNVTGVATTGPDFSTVGLPSLTTPLQPGHILGDGNLNTVFKPTAITRGDQGTVSVTYENDPILKTTTTVEQPLCGEGTSRGARVLVTKNGVPAAVVKKIQLTRLTGNRKSISVDNVLNVTLQTVPAAGPACGSFQFQREWGGVSNPIQLTAGDYQVTVTLNNSTKSKTVSFTLGTCSFNQNIVVPF
ncbi:MAG TPA: choice-of-anchor D domain-containing protein [Candidatus Binataceae bacterium]|nr:choice-of-anchor D domain-containing protein [Candidatus Binataceae bacterium]